MLPIKERDLPEVVEQVLTTLQGVVDASQSYPAQVLAAKTQWDAKNSTLAKASAFRSIRTILADMCVGPIRCAYCEDSLADEIEHIQPKNLFPEATFLWRNYLYACGPCNGPKSNRYGFVEGTVVKEFKRTPKDKAVPPPDGPSALINPRYENPLDYIDLDLGGVLADQTVIEGTFYFIPLFGLSALEEARASFSIDVLGLNREVLRVARANAFGGFRARLKEYVEAKIQRNDHKCLTIKADLLRTPHLSVFAEMRRQRSSWPDLNNLFVLAPEAELWPLIKQNGS